MMRLMSLIFASCTMGMSGQDGSAFKITKTEKALPLAGESFRLDGNQAFVIVPPDVSEDIPWVWYAPTLKGLPSTEERWMFKKFLAAGIAIAGIDVGESYGSPDGRGIYSKFYAYLREARGFRAKPCLFARSRGGLMHYNWAAEYPGSVGGIAGIYPVCNLASYPGTAKAAPGYGMSANELKAELPAHNPIDLLEAIAGAGVPVLHIHGDRDAIVPLEENSAKLITRYLDFGGPGKLVLIEGRGHDMWKGWFQSDALTDFAMACALGEKVEFEDEAADDDGKVVYQGKLRGGIMAIGGETTGWLLNYEKEGKKKTIEVEMKGIDRTGQFDGKVVKISGNVVTKKYMERGPVSILQASDVSVVE